MVQQDRLIVTYSDFLMYLTHSGIIKNRVVTAPYVIKFGDAQIQEKINVTGLAFEADELEGDAMIIYFGNDQELLYYAHQFESSAFDVYKNNELIITKEVDRHVQKI